MKYDDYPGRNAYGTDLQKQNMILNNMSEIIEGMRVINKIQDGVVKTNKSLLPFQNGILLSNLSLQNTFFNLI